MSSRVLRDGRVQVAGGAPGVGRAAAAVLALLLFLPASARPAAFERTFSYGADQLTVADLIGAVRVEGHDGNDFRVTVKVQGEDASEDLIHFEEHNGSRAELLVQFPTREHRRYVYPKMGRGSTTILDMKDRDDDDWLHKLLDFATGERITVRGRSGGSGLELWADVVVQVPRGRETEVRLGVGSIEAVGVEGATRLRVKSGPASAENMDGDLLIDTGSGAVDVRRVRGEVDIDTGSGGVDVTDVRDAQRVKIDTGSGGVHSTGVAAKELEIDTGSGRVELSDIDVGRLAVDTGSGGVDGEGIATDEILVDTGSGGVNLDLTRMGRGRYDVDTGSGGIRLDLPQDVSAEFDVETGSGGIDTDIEGVNLGRRSRHEAHFTVGGGDARVTLSTGSGGVHLYQGRGSARR